MKSPNAQNYRLGTERCGGGRQTGPFSGASKNDSIFHPRRSGLWDNCTVPVIGLEASLPMMFQPDHNRPFSSRDSILPPQAALHARITSGGAEIEMQGLIAPQDAH
jgi:hypothetical protein